MLQTLRSNTEYHDSRPCKGFSKHLGHMASLSIFSLRNALEENVVKYMKQNHVDLFGYTRFENLSPRYIYTDEREREAIWNHGQSLTSTTTPPPPLPSPPPSRPTPTGLDDGRASTHCLKQFNDSFMWYYAEIS